MQVRAADQLGDHRAAERAAAAIADAVSPAPPIEHETIVPLLEGLRYLVRRSGVGEEGRAAACRAALERLERQFASPVARAALLEARGLEAAAGGALPGSASLFARAADTWQEGVFPLPEARARAAAAHALQRRGRTAEAEAQRERARTLLASLAEQIPTGELRDAFARAGDTVLAAG